MSAPIEVAVKLTVRGCFGGGGCITDIPTAEVAGLVHVYPQAAPRRQIVEILQLLAPIRRRIRVLKVREVDGARPHLQHFRSFGTSC